MTEKISPVSPAEKIWPEDPNKAKTPEDLARSDQDRSEKAKELAKDQDPNRGRIFDQER